VDEGLIKMAEDMAQTDLNELQKNLAAVESCGSIRKI
jgi:hypothetical protein